MTPLQFPRPGVSLPDKVTHEFDRSKIGFQCFWQQEQSLDVTLPNPSFWKVSVSSKDLAVPTTSAADRPSLQVVCVTGVVLPVLIMHGIKEQHPQAPFLLP